MDRYRTRLKVIIIVKVAWLRQFCRADDRQPKIQRDRRSAPNDGSKRTIELNASTSRESGIARLKAPGPRTATHDARSPRIGLAKYGKRKIETSPSSLASRNFGTVQPRRIRGPESIGGREREVRYISRLLFPLATTILIDDVRNEETYVRNSCGVHRERTCHPKRHSWSI